MLKCEGCDEHHCQCPSCKCCAVCIKKCPGHERSKYSVEEFLKMTSIII
jgi:hypothetical protein